MEDDIWKAKESHRMSSKNIKNLLKVSKPHFNETIFMQQKKKIQEIMSVPKSREILKRTIDINQLNKLIMFNDINTDDNNNWEYSTFEVENLYNEDTPIISNIIIFILGTEWSESNINPSQKGIELRGLIFRSKDNTTEVTANFSLKGESSLWIITRSDLEFDEYSSIIRISKEDKSQNVHVSLGTFVKDKYSNLIFKIFSKQQLIDYSKNDICEIKAYIFDSGEEKITTKIFKNVTTSEFFLPFYEKKSRIMIAGSGQQCSVKSFVLKTHVKTRKENGDDRISIISHEKRNCDCCMIF